LKTQSSQGTAKGQVIGYPPGSEVADGHPQAEEERQNQVRVGFEPKAQARQPVGQLRLRKGSFAISLILGILFKKG
jgi:hypothetical protein